MSLIEATLASVDSACPQKGDVLEAVLKDKRFIDKCRYYKMFKEWCTGGCSSDYYRAKMSNLILHQNNPDLLRLCAKFAKLPPMQYHDSYDRSSLNQSQFSILKECGFLTESPKVGLRLVSIDQNIRDLSQWVL